MATKKRAQTSDEGDLKVMELVQKSGILNKSATLEQIMGLSMSVSSSGFGAAATARWAIVSKHYVAWGDQKT